MRYILRVRLRVLLALLVCVTGACRRGTGTRCERVCKAESDCSEKLDLPDSDKAGCIEACVELERDPRTQTLVDEHVACVGRSRDCVTLLECP